MRRTGVLILTLGLVASQGCHKTLQHTGGACDCYPPPVESLLAGPSPTNGNGVQYASGYAPSPNVTAANAAIGLSNGSVNAPATPLGVGPTPANTPRIITPTPSGNLPPIAPTPVPGSNSPETIRKLPRVLDSK